MAPTDALARGHRDAVADYLRRARELSAAAWSEPTAPGKWSPAELTLHLTLTYEGLHSELAGGPGIRVRVRGWKLLSLRVLVLPRLLREGRIPPVRAPRELVPSQPDADAAAALARFAASAEAFEAAITPRLGSRKGGITHPFFGPLTPAQGLRFAEVHLRHHTGQLPMTAGS